MNFESQFSGDTISQSEIEVRRRRIMIAIGVLSVLFVLALVGLRIYRAGTDMPAPVDNRPLVTVVRPGRVLVDVAVEATGSLAARREMPVGVVGEGGQVQAVLVEPGDWVRSGQVLARVERSVQSEQSRSLGAQIAVAQADAKLAQADLDRAQALVSRGFISKADIDRKTATRDAAVARVRVAQAQYAEQRARVGRLDIRAPASGLVLTRGVEPGQVIGAGNGVLFRLAKDGQMELLARVAEADLPRMRPGISATVTPVGGDRSYTGQVWQVSPVIDPQTRQGTVRIALSYDKGLRPGGFASATIISGQGDAPVLPESALQHDEKGSFVYIAAPGDVIQRRDIKTGQISAQGVSIVAGLSGDERVVILAGGFVNPGQKVRPEEKPRGK
ncbi:efflux RND transporter periplasmic adaptor subunit [Sphingobium subterraneum]|uniref:RND family efflux transporter MFP subunit n=1 Tax=Sphingobium subterraneum TaxID=627688 RepID=A0A841J8L3_9SPHN|nr:efflux RND transporter periplasmic adaptor subunit [Sphingobium subterraneum]MBB6124511.1 RND family efflux transporter MFP subunit [Sphingobium subterraneum]